MNRPWIIWSLSAFCALVVFGAMGLVTQHTLSLEKGRVHAEAKAELEERIRLALWRMDTAAAGILAEENNRPASQFRDVDFLGSQANVFDNVKLHFEVENGVFSATKDDRDWQSLESALNREAEGLRKSKPADNLAQNDVSMGDNNLDVIRAVARENQYLKEEDPAWSAQVAEAKQQRAARPNAMLRNTDSYQSSYNQAEKVKRQSIVSKSVGKVFPQKKNKKEAGKREDIGADQIELAQKTVLRGQARTDQDRGLNEENAWKHLSSLTPMWLDQDLILVREVADQSGKRVQGVWLDASAIEKSLLDDIDDLFEHARLDPVRLGLDVLLGNAPDTAADDPMVLAALPWRLVPGEKAEVGSVGWTPMRKTLVMAWIGMVLAALAAVVLLRGVVKLSERRASFVSSVTHELRTPLTTFSLYSDMLAEGMVQDEVKQKEYLQTLRRESSRLTHLVENVLAYSRIERGSARARVENVRVGDLVDRMTDRLRQRAEEAGMELEIDMPAELVGKEIEVDTTAVEQIIFNLVDNASKYASGEDCGKMITFRVLSPLAGKGVLFQVCDQGPGVKTSEHRRLFRAFHKSAQEAAHSKPGVGLGLALSRRLARALGGDLRIVEQERGACFELRIT